MKTKVNPEQTTVTGFNPRNYRNSPTIREFYRFVAKNNLRAEALKMLESKTTKSKTSYLSKVVVN